MSNLKPKVQALSSFHIFEVSSSYRGVRHLMLSFIESAFHNFKKEMKHIGSYQILHVKVICILFFSDYFRFEQWK